ncbi:MAG: hypothetical protein SFW63_04725 [Alphaproteobacteria bacterium]|nr:hypothetical protein [Alphaproteobacteria bacterium]
MTTTTKLASAALAGLLTAGLLAVTPAFAGEHDKGSCSGKDGCKGKAAAEKSECKGHAGEKSGCEGKDKKEGHSCSGKDGCGGKDEGKKAEEKK